MLNQSGVTITSGMARKSILIDTKNRFATSCRISGTGITADSDGRKVVKSGTPLVGSLTERETAFTVGKSSTDNVVGILLDEVDVTKGDANGNCLIFGFVDETKLDASVVAAITSVTKAKLPLITFIK